MSINPYQKYQQQSVMTMSPGEMLIKVFDEVIKELNRALMFLENQEMDKVHAGLLKSQRILTHLRVTLDMQYDISMSLDALYEYFIYQLVQANVHKDAEPIRVVLPMISELRDTFAQADKINKTSCATAAQR